MCTVSFWTLPVSRWALWMDPARRELRGAKKAQTERLFDPEAFSPRSRSC